MRLLVSGSTGFIGSALVPSLAAQGHEVTRLVRSAGVGGRVIPWDPARRAIEASALEGFDGVIHLSGEPLVGRWTAARMHRIRASRVDSTRFLSEALAQRSQPPRVLITASAIGYYGSRGDEVLDEQSPPGCGFLADVCQAWEAAAQPAIKRGLRVAHLRIGLVLGASGGILAKMLPPFRLGLGGVLGGGTQYMSWIALDDLLAITGAILTDEALRGPVNVVAPGAVTNREFTKTLGRLLRRPTPVPVPAVALRLLFGALADEALLASARVVPAKLLSRRFAFRFPTLEAALRRAAA